MIDFFKNFLQSDAFGHFVKVYTRTYLYMYVCLGGCICAPMLHKVFIYQAKPYKGIIHPVHTGILVLSSMLVVDAWHNMHFPLCSLFNFWRVQGFKLVGFLCTFRKLAVVSLKPLSSSSFLYQSQPPRILRCTCLCKQEFEDCAQLSA